MKKTMWMTLMLAALAFGQTTARKSPAVKKADPVSVPAGAKQTPDGSWEHTDAQGKQWVYKQTPFGFTRMSKAAADAARVETAVPEGLSVVEQSGAYKFTRRTPFGTVNYTKKTDDLDEGERAVVAAMTRKAAIKETAAKK